jgi:DNA-binding FadR family transcriptional regulator
VRRANLGTPRADNLTMSHHRAILDAIQAGSEDAAAKAMRLHLEDVARLWNEVATERGVGANSHQAHQAHQV